MSRLDIDPDRLEPASSTNRITQDTNEEMASRYLALGLQISRLGEPFEKPLRIRVTSNSMSPLLRPGDFVYLEFAKAESLRRGDIVTFLVGQTLMTHRLISAGPGCCHTKGDALLCPDPPIDPSKLLGRLVAYEHEGKTVWMTGLFWSGFNRLEGQMGFWQSKVARLGDHLFQRNHGAQLPPWSALILRLFFGLLRLPVKVMLKLYFAISDAFL